MSEKLRQAIEQWREADTEARAAEHLLTQAYCDIFFVRGTAMSGDLIDQVVRMRTRSNEALTQALTLMKAGGGKGRPA